ncbi:MAG TPA: choice-of-anchor D domain-containing protein, partial [Verrucomicrobiae bacterium]|nr:choice-of-anchor D domain-containing protein [Verrucomicrobiae bacterium]
FARKEVFRASPHLLNVAQTAPYGLSGEFANLRDFAAGAVAQHFPRSLARVSGRDFREPTAEELVAMEAFMNSIVTPANGDLSLDRFVTTEAQKRGRALFFGNEAKCSKCHSGPMLAHSDGSLPGSLAGMNEIFDTGVANLAKNGPAGSNLPTEPAGLARSTRKFNVPPLFGVRLTAPYFHDGSATNLRAAVEFYDEADFVSSPSGPLVGPMPAVNDPAKVADLVAFLESLVDIPIEFTREATFGIRCAGGPPPGVITVGVTNIGTNNLVIAKLAFVGPNPEDFRIAVDSGETSLAPGRTRRIEIEFKPGSQGSKRATLEFTARDPDIPGAIRFAIALSGAFVDNVVTATPQAIVFPTSDINPPPGALPIVRFVRVTNTGSGPLEFVRVSFAGAHPDDFRVSGDSGATNLAPGGVRTLGIAFAPQARGPRSAVLRIESVACIGEVIDVALSGAAMSSLEHFKWTPISSPQGFNAAFRVRISAVDRNGELIGDFTNGVSLSAISGPNPTNTSASSIVITELDPGSPDAIEFMNVSSAPVDISGWQVSILDQVAITTPLNFTFPAGSIAPPGALFTLTESVGAVPGVFPNFFGGFNISWIGAFSNLAVQVRNTQGAVVDFATGSPLGAGVFFFPTVPASEWSGGGFQTPAQDGVTSYQRIGNADHNNASDWVIAPLSMGAINPGLSGAFANPARIVTLSKTNTTPFLGGVWTGEVAVGTEAVEVRLNADDGAGHGGQSDAFNVLGTPPTISSLPNITISEDTLSPLLSFNVNDAETPPSALTVTATSSNATLVTPSGIQLGGTANLRTIRVMPAPNQFGTADITVRVSDGSSSASRDFRLTVMPLNDPPVLLPVGNRTVTERTAVSINVLATDPDLPNDVLTFTLLQGPAGANIDSASGIIQWFPTELQGGQAFNFQVSVRDMTGLTAASNFVVNVLKVNSAPTLDPVPPQTVYAGGLLRFTNTALDLDIPTNFLTFSLATSVPGASINPTSGVVTWAPLLSQVGLNVLRPVVRDNGPPPMSATQAVTVMVVRPPMNFTTNLDFGVHCVDAPPAEPMLIGITNSGATHLTLLTAQFSGTNLADFPILSDTGQTSLEPGAVRWIEVGFVPQNFGRQAASFNLSATADDPLGSFSFTVPLAGAFVDSTVAVNGTAVDFGQRSIDAPFSPPQIVAITNLGFGPLQVDAVNLFATNGFEFSLVSDSGENPVPPGGTRQWQFVFAPRSRGAKSARFVLDSLSCNNGHVEVSLAGVGTSTLDHFAWEPIGTTQAMSAPFPIRLTALDRNNQTVAEFAGPAALSAFVALPSPPPRIVISEIDPGTPDAVEFVNVSGTAQNLAGWQVFLYDDTSFPNSVANFSLNGTVPSNGVFTVTEGGIALGQLPNFFIGGILFWHGASTNIAVLLRDNLGAIVDFATTGDRTQITFPVTIPTNQWSGPGIPAEALDEVFSYNRIGFSDHNDLSDWALDARGIGALHPGLTAPFPTNRILESFPAATGSFTNGVWAGGFGVLEEASMVRLQADDGAGHATASGSFTVRGAPPFLSDIPNQTIDEDTVTQEIQFFVSDTEQAAGTLAVSAV